MEESIPVTASRYDELFNGGLLPAAERALRLGRLGLDDLLTQAMESARAVRTRLSGALLYAQQRVHLGDPNADPGDENHGNSDLDAIIVPVVIGQELPLETAWRVNIVEMKPAGQRLVGAGLLPQVGAILVRRERPARVYEVVALEFFDPSLEATAAHQGRRAGDVVAFLRSAEHRKKVMGAFGLGGARQ
jgi:hypothetical protein